MLTSLSANGPNCGCVDSVFMIFAKQHRQAPNPFASSVPSVSSGGDAKDSRRNNLSNYGAGILAAGKARARRISAVICNERATQPAAKRPSQNAQVISSRVLTRIFHTCCRIRGWDRRPACPGRRLADRNVKQHPAIKRVFSTLIVLRIPPGQWPGGTGGSPVPPRRCEIYGLRCPGVECQQDS